jgi:hypothetical protein
MVTKAHILQEIKRTAEQNGGKPLGRQRFERETGIKGSDWYGIYWTRWGDAIRETGLIPNQLTCAYKDTHILEKYAQLAGELGRLPTAGDLRLKTRSDPGFPSHTTFSKLGTKSELVERLLRYCQDQGGFEDVICMCREYIPHKQDASDESVEQEEEFGFVYLIKSGRFHKIGRSNAAGRREYELAIQLPEKAKMIHVIRTDDPSGIEAYWHKRFEAKRKNGEWFELSATDIAAFRRRKFQ